MAIVCPTVTANDPHIFRTQIERIQGFAKRIHVDLADGVFAPKLLDVSKLWWPEDRTIDVHLMYQRPLYYLEALVALKPSLVIVHAEADGDFSQVVGVLKNAGIKVGVALLATTPVDAILSEISKIDHVLIFSGSLGHFGGNANLDLLNKASKIKSISPDIELGWDGGINEDNAKMLVKGGVNVLDVGGFIQRADNPIDAYAKLNLAIMDGQ
jgi:ribulose-phosphate 3-epimerase